MKKQKCELGTEFCRKKPAGQFKVVSKDKSPEIFWACLACVAILGRQGIKCKQV